MAGCYNMDEMNMPKKRLLAWCSIICLTLAACSAERRPDKMWSGTTGGTPVEVKLYLAGSGNPSWPDRLEVKVGEKTTAHPGRWGTGGYIGSYSGLPPDAFNAYNILEIGSDGRVELANPSELGSTKRVPLTIKQ